MLKITGYKDNRRQKKYLTRKGFTLHKSGSRSGYWTRTEENGWRSIMRWCIRNHLHFVKVEGRYTRSESYRRSFLRHNKGLDGEGQWYRCAYCGRRIPVKKMEVDHVISCKAAEESHWARTLLTIRGIPSVNDPENLVPACHRCNQKKGASQGGWVIQGILGSQSWYWPVLRTIQCFLLLLAICIIWSYWPIISEHIQAFLYTLQTVGEISSGIAGHSVWLF